MDYLRNNLLQSWREEVLKYCINDLIRIGNTITLRAKGGHSRIKQQLNNTSIGIIT